MPWQAVNACRPVMYDDWRCWHGSITRSDGRMSAYICMIMNQSGKTFSSVNHRSSIVYALSMPYRCACCLIFPYIRSWQSRGQSNNTCTMPLVVYHQWSHQALLLCSTKWVASVLSSKHTHISGGLFRWVHHSWHCPMGVKLPAHLLINRSPWTAMANCGTPPLTSVSCRSGTWTTMESWILKKQPTQQHHVVKSRNLAPWYWTHVTDLVIVPWALGSSQVVDLTYDTGAVGCACTHKFNLQCLALF
jgi:hypothetical protein